MSGTSRGLSSSSIALFLLLASSALPAWAEDGEYPISGKVLSSTAKGPHSYQVETDTRIYQLMCVKTGGFHLSAPDCKVGDKSIAAGDTVQLRVDGDRAYMPGAKGGKEDLLVLTVEMKTIPPLPAEEAAAQAPPPGHSRGLVIGTGMHLAGQGTGWSTSPGTGMATGPVMAIPTTGGAPVMMMPIGPVGGGVVTGVPVTGGAPIVGMPIGGAAHAGGQPAGGGGGPVWVHLVRVWSDGKVYQLECSRKPCELEKKNLDLGDTLIVRTDKKWAYLSSATNTGRKEEKLRLLGVTDAPAPPDAK